MVLDNRSNGIIYEKITFFDYDNINFLYFIKPFNAKQKNILNNNNINNAINPEINTDLIMDKNGREIIKCLLKEKYINTFDETKISILQNKNSINNKDKEKPPFDLLIKLGAKTMLLLIFEKCDEFASINIKSQINFVYPLYIIISEKKNRTSIVNRLEYKDKKIEIYEIIIEHTSGVVFYYINKEKELNANINIIFKVLKNLILDLTSDQLELNEENKKNNSIKTLEDNTGIEINLNCLTNSFFSFKAKNIFENFSYSFENKYTIYY